MNKDPHQRPLLWNFNIGIKERILKFLGVQTGFLQMIQSESRSKCATELCSSTEMRSQGSNAFQILEMIFNLEF